MRSGKARAGAEVGGGGLLVGVQGAAILTGQHTALLQLL